MEEKYSNRWYCCSKIEKNRRNEVTVDRTKFKVQFFCIILLFCIIDKIDIRYIRVPFLRFRS